MASGIHDELWPLNNSRALIESIAFPIILSLPVLQSSTLSFGKYFKPYEDQILKLGNQIGGTGNPDLLNEVSVEGTFV